MANIKSQNSREKMRIIILLSHRHLLRRSKDGPGRGDEESRGNVSNKV
jgi:hypothetical protein